MATMTITTHTRRTGSFLADLEFERDVDIPVTLSVEHASSSYGVPVVLDADGNLLDVATIDADHIHISTGCTDGDASLVLALRDALGAPQIDRCSAGVVHVGEADSHNRCDHCSNDVDWLASNQV